MSLLINIGQKGSGLFQAIAFICDTFRLLCTRYLLVTNSLKIPYNIVY